MARTVAAPRARCYDPAIKAVITFARGWNALAAARSLGRRGIRIVAGDEFKLTPTMFSKFTVESFVYPNPDREPAAFLDTLEAVLRSHGPGVMLMPIHKETYLIARERARFEPICRMALPTYEQIITVHDKGTLARLAAQRGIPGPRTVVPESREEFCDAAATFEYPAFVKLRESAAAVGVKKTESADEAITAFDDFTRRFKPAAPPLLQAGVGGDDYCATFLFERGALRATMTYHNLRAYPRRSGTGVLRETVEAPAIERIGAELLGSLGWHGVAEIDFRWEGGDSTPQLIEVNPRFWGGLTQAVEAGWDYPYMLYRLAVDGTVPPAAEGDRSVRTEAPALALLATLQEVVNDAAAMERMKAAFEELRGGYVRGSRRRALRKFFGGLGGTLDVKGRMEQVRALFADHANARSDVFKWSDPLPALGMLYPLAVFVKHGKVSLELLVSEGPGDQDSEGD